MLGRRQELNLQFLQIVDGLLMAFAFWFAHAFRLAGSAWFVFDKPIGPFTDFQWLLFVILPFGPSRSRCRASMRTGWRNPSPQSRQIASAAFWVGLLIAACAYFLKLSVPSRR
jgi:hypothetical protein